MRAPSGLGYEARWVNVPPLLEREQLVADTHACIGRAGRDKLLEALQQHHWWPGMYLDAAKCVRTSATSQREHVGPKPREDLRWIDKEDVPLWGWAIDMAGAFPKDPEGNRYLFGFIDPFSKWVEVFPCPSRHSWRAAQLLPGSACTLG